jgi:uncharacterized protein (TIGR03435 family)
MKPTIAGSGLVLAAFTALLAQTAPTFEVASIKQAAPQTEGRFMVRMGSDPGRVDYANVSLKNVLARAYKVKQYQINGPAWLDSERYDITAKVPDGVKEDQVPAMLQALLVERFNMSVHKESKEQSIYALVVGKGGPKLKESDPGDDKGPAMIGGNGAKLAGALGGGGGRGGGGMMMVNGNGRIQANGVGMPNFSDMLSNMLDKPVMDMTELKGRYDITLEMSPDEMAGMKRMAGGRGMAGGGGAGADHGPAPDGEGSASIFTAIQGLGLKLEPRKAPVDFVVVDKADRVPTAN